MEDPQVVQNSDKLYKQNVEWVKDIPITPPTDYEVKMLDGTITPAELLKKEQSESVIELTPEQKRMNNITIVKVVALNRIGLHHFIFSPYNLSNNQKKKYKDSMSKVLDEFNESSESRTIVINEFNEVVCDKILHSTADVSSYPIYS
jgi:hypothetical protein